ncbi:MAG TPA: AsmA family protein [Candidatus Binatia bacterium]|nr:AsmA family protein [Candidatus Binatia bacterium]
MKRILKILGIVIAVLLVIMIILPFVIDANTFRPKLESELTDALGRQVKVGNLSLSLLSGGVSADNISIADDPQFSRSPFVQAKSLKVGVEMWPLIFSRTLNVTELTLDDPQISLVKSENGEKWNFSSLGGKNPSAPTQGGKTAPAASSNTAKTAPEETASSEKSSGGNSANLSVAKLNVNDGKLTVLKAGSSEPPRVYDKVNIEVKNFSFTSSFPFSMTANTPSGGTLKLAGTAGPINPTDTALTPLNAKIAVQHMNLASSGFLDPAAGISGIADLDGTIESDGHQAKASGTLRASNLVVVKKGSPAGRPVDVKFGATHDLVRQTGLINQCDISMGQAVSHLTGSYDAHGKVTSVNLKLVGNAMPVDDLEAMLPAVGVVLPPKATLKGGHLNINVASSGPVDKLVSTGSIKMENTQLANFNLGAQLGAVLSALSGKAPTGNDTTIQNFSSDVKMTPAGTEASNINLTVPSIGVLTGGGTVSPSNDLAFKMKAEVGGTGIPFGVTGTAQNPKFTPDVKGIAGGLVEGFLNNQGKSGAQQQQNPVNTVMGLFGKKKQPPK